MSAPDIDLNGDLDARTGRYDDLIEGGELLEAVVLPGPGSAPRRPRKVMVWVATAMFAIVLLFIIVIPLTPDYHSSTQNLDLTQVRPFTSRSHILGTDALGRDVLSRLALAGRVSLLIAVSVVAINLLIGVTLGLVAGYFGGVADTLIMGLADIQLTVPVILLLVAIIAAIGPSVTTLVVVLGVTFWVRGGRIVRVVASSLREREFVLASVTHGASDRWVIWKHVVPSVVPQLIVLATFDLGVVITAEASLSYLGLGVQPPTPSWGGMISDGQQYLQTNPWLCVLPGIMVFLVLGSLAILGQYFAASYGGINDAAA